MDTGRKTMHAAADQARLFTRLAVIGCVASLGLALLVLVLGVIRDTFAGSDTWSLAVIPFFLSALFGAGGIVYGMLATQAAEESEEKALLEQRKQDQHAFDVEEDVRFTAGRGFANYKKYAPYALAILAALFTGLMLFFFLRYWNVRMVKALPVNSLHAAFVAIVITAASIFTGAFYIGQARQKAFRWLRPIGAFLVCGFAVMLCATAAALANHLGVPAWDGVFARIFVGIFALLGVEFVLNVIVEFYRPRTLAEARPVFESKLLALFTEPGGVMRNIADALDYQFGFKVSGTWIYGFLERSIFPLLICWALVLWLSSSLQEVGPGEVAYRVRFGRVVSRELLRPGVYFTLPWPFGTLDRYSCSKLQTISLGSQPEAGDGKKVNPDVVLWTKQHAGTENNFIVAVEPERGSVDSTATPISFIGLMIPVQYRIRESQLYSYAYENVDARSSLKRLGGMVLTEYFASSSLHKVMSTARGVVEDELQRRIQKVADRNNLGVEIVRVNMVDVHPPIEKVAPAFQNVIGAMIEKESIVLKAEAYRARVVPEAQSGAMRIVAESGNYRNGIVRVAEAESNRFRKQLLAYRAMPSIYMLRSYLDFLERDCSEIRKFVVSSTLKNEIYELNFEEKAQLDLIDSELSSLNSNPGK